jgi:hypothetical protein
MKSNQFIEEEKKNLMSKLNEFNPLNTKAISNYLDQSEKNQVSDQV